MFSSFLFFVKEKKTSLKSNLGVWLQVAKPIGYFRYDLFQILSVRLYIYAYVSYVRMCMRLFACADDY